jgi:hypothetical protein
MGEKNKKFLYGFGAKVVPEYFVGMKALIYGI